MNFKEYYEQLTEASTQGVEDVYQDRKWVLRKLLSHASCVALGSRFKAAWDPANPKGEKLFKKLTTEGDLFFLENKESGKAYLYSTVEDRFLDVANKSTDALSFVKSNDLQKIYLKMK